MFKISPEPGGESLGGPEPLQCKTKSHPTRTGRSTRIPRAGWLVSSASSDERFQVREFIGERFCSPGYPFPFKQCNRLCQPIFPKKGGLFSKC